MHWSKTRHENFLSCPRKFFYSEIASQHNPEIKTLSEHGSIHLTRHEIVREILSQAIRKNKGVVEDAAALIKKAEEKLLFCGEDQLQTNTELTIIQSCIENYGLFYEKELKDGKVLYMADGEPSEFVFNKLSMMVLPELVLDKGEYLQVIGWKTGQIRWHKEDSLRLRAGGLTCWVRCALKEFKKDIGVTEIYLRDSCLEQSLTLDDSEIRTFLDEAKTVRDDYSKSALMKDFSANPSGGSCRFCQFKGLCIEYEQYNSLGISESVEDEAIEEVSAGKVFLCHVSEDKEAFVRPFARLLEKDGIDFWLDEAEVSWGESILRAINRGLKESKYVLCFMSDNFLARGWPQAELESALTREYSGKEKKVLPLMLTEPQKILDEIPILDGKRYVKWSEDMFKTLKELKKTMGI